jgi:hypothetical protein
MNRHRKNTLWLVGVMSLFPLASVSMAANVNERPFELQFAEADFVVVAKMSKPEHVGRRHLDATGLMQLTRMKALRVLKGPRNITKFDFVTRDEISELDPRCCERDKIYILLLRRGSNQNIYAAVNGHYSVIPIR